MILYGYWRSSATYRVRIALALKDVAYEYAPVNLLKGEQRDAPYRKKNPLALVPALELPDGAIVTQSIAIMEYLEEVRPTPSILPDGLNARAQARAIAAAIACEAQPLMNLRVQQYLKTELGMDERAIHDWLDRLPGAAMGAIEQMTRETGGAFCVGDTPSIADCCLAPQIYAAKRFGIDISAFTRLNEIYARCLEHPAFQQAAPENQPDAP